MGVTNHLLTGMILQVAIQVDEAIQKEQLNMEHSHRLNMSSDQFGAPGSLRL